MRIRRRRRHQDRAEGHDKLQRRCAFVRLIVLFAPLLTCLLLIATGAILDAADIHNPIIAFLSSPVIALIGLVGTSRRPVCVGAEPIQHAMATGWRRPDPRS